MKISACYIVKNSAADLARSIGSLREYVDEVIVVDTGSTDGTLAVAERFGAQIFYDEWQDDFSKPRNIALENATGDWIIFLDADEFFSVETAQNVRFAATRAEKFQKQGLLVYLVNIDVDAGNKILGANYVLRIFKNLRDLHYVGKIHEELRLGKKILSPVTVAPPNILTIYHTGYSASINRAKAERNLKMLLNELDETKEPQRIYGYIAECYDGLGDFANAEKFARLEIKSNKKITRPYRILLKILSEEPERLNERERFSLKAVKAFPNLPEFTAELAECYAARKDFKKAVETMTQAIKKFQNYRGVEPTTFNAEIINFVENRIKIWSAEF